MSTFAHAFFSTLEERWEEVDLLIEMANEKLEEDENLYNVLCRSAVVLIVAHYEGFIKELAKILIDDINNFSEFKNAPNAYKRTFCTLFTNGEEKGNEKNITRLVETFESLNTKFQVEPFLYDRNKNPSPNVIDKISTNFGVKNFFHLIETSAFDDVFIGEKSIQLKLLSSIKKHIMEGVEEYPYKIDPYNFQIDVGKKIKNQRRTLWETFLDELLKKRHAIAHGTTLENGLSVDDIKDFKNKITLLQYILALVLCHNSVQGYYLKELVHN